MPKGFPSLATASRVARARRALLSVDPAPQTACPLYAVPAEIRQLIFTFALTDYPDPNPQKQYGDETCFTRPEYAAPRRTDFGLLLTCRAIYAETWFLPFALKEHTHWLTASDRAPPEYAKVLQAGGAASYFDEWLEALREQPDADPPEIRQLRVFAQMWALERQNLAFLMSSPGMRPRRLILTIRHADWWYWEDDEPLEISGCWIEPLSKVLPSSVREFCIELETVQRKTEQLDDVARQIRERWFFKRADGVALFPDATGKNVEVSRWAGSSKWDYKRWVQEETAPGRIDYYVLRIPFRPQNAISRAGGTVSEDVRRAADGDVYDGDHVHVSPDKVRKYEGRDYIPLDVYGDEIEEPEEGVVWETDDDDDDDDDDFVVDDGNEEGAESN